MRRILFAAPLLLLLSLAPAAAFAGPAHAIVRIPTSPDQRMSQLVRAARALEATQGVHDVRIDLFRSEVRAELSGADGESLLTALRDSGISSDAAPAHVIACVDDCVRE